MNHKTWLTVFGVLALVLIGGAGFYAFSSYGKFSEEISGWDSKVGTIESLERRVPYPSKENAESLKATVEEYDTAVKELYQSLNTFQRPLNTTLVGTQFQQQVKVTVQEFREFAREGGLEIQSTEEFQLGFDAYASSSIPSPELVPVLDYELEAINHLLRKLVASGVGTLISFERDAIPGEAGNSSDHESGVVHKYPVRFRFHTDHSSLQTFINSIANDKDFFYIVRVLKVQNDATEGPIRRTGGEDDTPDFINPETNEYATYEQQQLWGVGTASLEEVIAAAAAEGYMPSEQDARVLMGQEKLEVYMVVDIVRFVNPDEDTDTEKSEDEEDK